MNNQAEIKMKEYLGLPEDFKATFQDMYTVATRFEEMTGNDQEVSPFGIVWWLDIYGNFTEKKDKYSKIVNQIFIGMGKDIAQLLPFIELCANKYKEDEE